MVIPVGDRFFLWVDYSRGIIYSDVRHETLELRYVSLPVEPDPKRSNHRSGSSYHNICATNDGHAVRFVGLFPRCCCGCPGATFCTISRHAYTSTMWDLKMDDMMTWDKVGVIDCDELWSLPGYRGFVPRIRPTYPTISMDDPGVLCFSVHNVDGDRGTWLIELDSRGMELRSICYHDRGFYFCPNVVVSKVSQYFDASRSCTRERQIDTSPDAPARPSRLAFPKLASDEEMLATLQEIPNLACDDMLKVYDILMSDVSRFKFRSLLALPIDMRNNYCLLIGKLSCFHV
jgi:hypothetical protein